MEPRRFYLLIAIPPLLLVGTLVYRVVQQKLSAPTPGVVKPSQQQPPPPPRRADGRATIADRLAECGTSARARLSPHFQRAGIAYPPARLTLVGIKQEKVLHLYAAPAGGEVRHIRAYPVIAASGQLGPKLREGDKQVPEGIYRVEFLNPNSRYHLSIRLNYPNDFDRRMGQRDGRTKLGGDIMIHGGDRSAGCLAMGDLAAEELFVLAADTGIDNIRILLTPVDFRRADAPPQGPTSRPWTATLYQQLAAEMRMLPTAK